MFAPDQLHHLLETYGVWAVAVIVGLESMGIPLPGEAILVLAAAYAGRHGGNIALVIASAASGAIIGDNVGYLVGRQLGSRFLRRYGSYVGLHEDRIRLGQYLFMRHGGKVVFFGRFFALLRFLAALLAGVNKMTWTKFLIANAAGGILWATVVGFTAYSFGHELHRIQGPLGAIGVLLAVIIAIAGFIYVRRNEAQMQAEADKVLSGPLPR